MGVGRVAQCMLTCVFDVFETHNSKSCDLNMPMAIVGTSV